MAETSETGAGVVVRIGAWARRGAAVLSLALTVGLCLWGARLIMRDAAGVPVLRAPEGPARVAPARPGGRQVAYQGLAVNRVQAEGTAARPADRLVLAPPPVALAPEDRPVSHGGEGAAARSGGAGQDAAAVTRPEAPRAPAGGAPDPVASPRPVARP